jgi:hypothetical protein
VEQGTRDYHHVISKVDWLMSYYVPRQGGHAPGDLREAFCDALDAFEDWKTGEPEPTVELRDKQLLIGQVFGLLWNCNDIVPGTIWRQVDYLGLCDEMPRHRTYAALARILKPATTP